MGKDELSGSTIEVLKKVPLFKGLSPSQVKLLLKICHLERRKAGEVVWQMGNASDRMFVVLTWSVAIGLPDSTLLVEQAPVLGGPHVPLGRDQEIADISRGSPARWKHTIGAWRIDPGRGRAEFRRGRGHSRRVRVAGRTASSCSVRRCFCHDRPP